MSHSFHTFGFTKKQVDFISTYLLYHIADVLVLQPAHGKVFMFFTHCIKYHVTYTFLKLINMIEENPDFTGNDSFGSHDANNCLY